VQAVLDDRVGGADVLADVEGFGRVGVGVLGAEGVGDGAREVEAEFAEGDAEAVDDL